MKFGTLYDSNTNTQHPVQTHKVKISIYEHRYILRWRDRSSERESEWQRLASALSKMEMEMITIVDIMIKNGLESEWMSEWQSERVWVGTVGTSVELTTLKYCYCVNILRCSWMCVTVVAAAVAVALFKWLCAVSIKHIRENVYVNVNVYEYVFP